MAIAACPACPSKVLGTGVTLFKLNFHQVSFIPEIFTELFRSRTLTEGILRGQVLQNLSMVS